MQITPTVRTLIEAATAKALATYGAGSVNVVPVSMVKVTESSIWLFDFFMDKTATNVQANPHCALTAWTEMRGVQIKGDASYHTSGSVFEEAVDWVATQNPQRVVKGLLIITPIEVYDISPGGLYSKEELRGSTD